MQLDPDRQALFDAWAARYDALVRNSSEFPFAGYQQVLDTIVAQAAALPTMRVLDLGCGTGNLTRPFADLACTTTGVDFSERMLAIAAAAVPSADFQHLDLRASWDVITGRTYDRIVSAYVFHEFDPATKRTLIQRLLSDHLNPKGTLVIGDIAFATRGAHDTAQHTWQHRWDPGEHYWCADDARAACEQIGITGTYQQVSFCAGVFTFHRADI